MGEIPSFDGKGFDEFEYGRLLRALKARVERVDATPPQRRGLASTFTVGLNLYRAKESAHKGNTAA